MKKKIIATLILATSLSAGAAMTEAEFNQLAMYSGFRLGKAVEMNDSALLEDSASIGRKFAAVVRKNADSSMYPDHVCAEKAPNGFYLQFDHDSFKSCFFKEEAKHIKKIKAGEFFLIPARARLRPLDEKGRTFLELEDIDEALISMSAMGRYKEGSTGHHMMDKDIENFYNAKEMKRRIRGVYTNLNINEHNTEFFYKVKLNDYDVTEERQGGRIVADVTIDSIVMRINTENGVLIEEVKVDKKGSKGPSNIVYRYSGLPGHMTGADVAWETNGRITNVNLFGKTKELIQQAPDGSYDAQEFADLVIKNGLIN